MTERKNREQENRKCRPAYTQWGSGNDSLDSNTETEFQMVTVRQAEKLWIEETECGKSLKHAGTRSRVWQKAVWLQQKYSGGRPEMKSERGTGASDTGPVKNALFILKKKRNHWTLVDQITR